MTFEKSCNANIYKCAASNSIEYFMTSNQFQEWIQYLHDEIVNGDYVNTDFHPDAQLRLYELFIEQNTRFKCLHNPVWQWATMLSPVPTYTRECSFSAGFLFSCGKF